MASCPSLHKWRRLQVRFDSVNLTSHGDIIFRQTDQEQQLVLPLAEFWSSKIPRFGFQQFIVTSLVFRTVSIGGGR
jgi:hypothetical protein